MNYNFEILQILIIVVKFSDFALSPLPAIFLRFRNTLHQISVLRTTVWGPGSSIFLDFYIILLGKDISAL